MNLNLFDIKIEKKIVINKIIIIVIYVKKSLTMNLNYKNIKKLKNILKIFLI